jgi:hypothetical protein
MNTELDLLNSLNKQSLDHRLRDKPQLQARFHALIDAVEAADDDCKTVAEAEARVTQEIRKIGLQVLESWSQRADQQAQAQVRVDHPKAVRDAKKNSTGTPPSEK